MLNDTEKEKVTQTQEKEKLDGRRETVHLAKIGLMVFITFVCCILFSLVCCVIRDSQTDGIK